MVTIIQDYGPIYGEVVNGTVQGRPNGSVYVPLSNTITWYGDKTGITISQSNPGAPYRIYGSKGLDLVAISQDLASNIVSGIYTDSDCTTIFGSLVSLPAGTFNLSNRKHFGNNYTEDTIVPGTTYYLRAQLMNNGVAVATSEVIEVEGA